MDDVTQWAVLPRSIRARGVSAVLGPTNTGKTHLAIDRMLGHESGLIGLPLRLLAREVYQRIVERIGPDKVALVTGEEKIKPKAARYWVATVEAMPRDVDVSFVAIDEVQLASDFDRGHVFTDRILNRRGRHETLLLGSGTMRNVVEKLIPGVNVQVRPRLSTLSFAGEKKISRLPRRSAIVAFSAEEVYAIAEFIRRQRGGAAVVMGALSPRTRNAQVELYQSGDVDYLVATDAIGMGLNLDVDHVAFASDRKFDGWQFRRLNPSEMAQIAGRAGRATRDGTFGSTGRCPPFEQELVERLEAHAFDAVKVLQWRNGALDFASIPALAASLAAAPREDGLARAPTADDVKVLEIMGADGAVAGRVRSSAEVERLWQVCQVPDYRKISPGAHAELVATLFGHVGAGGRIPDDWFARQIALTDRPEGDIDTLSRRIAQVRTLTFVANRPDWLEDPQYWQGVTRGVEDKLSDALHERLAQRFVDRRTSVLIRRLRENTMLETEISKTGDVTVEGHVIGHLHGFQFAADPAAGGEEAKALRAAAQKALAGEIEARALRVSQAVDEAFVLTNDGTIRWTGEAVAKLIPGDEVLKPRFKIIADEHLTGPAREQVEARLTLWIAAHIEKLLGPLNKLAGAEDITGIGRGIAFQIVESLGVLERAKVAEEMKTLDQAARATLRGYGVRFGAHHIYLPGLLKPAPRSLAAELYALKHGGLAQKGLDELPHLAASGRTSIPVDHEVQKGLYRAVGFRVCGERAVRVDILERLADLIRPALAWRPNSPGPKPPGAVDGRGFTVTVGMTSLAGCSGEDFASILKSLGYRMERRPPPPPEAEAAPVASADAAAAEPAPELAPVPEGAIEADLLFDAPAEALPETAAAETEVLSEADAAEPATDAAMAEDAAPADETPVDETPADEAPAEADPVEAAPQDGPADEDAAEADAAAEVLEAAGDPTAAETAAEVEAPAAPGGPEAVEGAPAEPEMIEVWRPGRPPGAPRRERPQGQRQGQGERHGERQGHRPHGDRPQGERPQGERPQGDRFQGDRRRDGRPPHRRSEGAPEGAEAERGPRPPRPDRPPRGPREGGDQPRPPRSEHRPVHQDRRRDKPVDPDSPFAALAALKARMESEKKGS
ncbi:helicase-related protein [Xanthobacter tagetidis]|uniref:Helicase n=1 Tax=Xanthobacter tagetidis TaxID=60216 RepID=A0A3L7AEA1_9HYPH|nr:helicase-related protein [Xanthobacter tagetidis]MBB6308505.1 ATP-dependent RNA helicase SUPV3L1/SUV3 [Xanthobacter tagetidis]RLP78719.1 helicase [Xanthobacter tagetidis]